jgi:hypothetical protein
MRVTDGEMLRARVLAALLRVRPKPNFIATMIGRWEKECKDAHAVSFSDFSRAGEQGSAKSPPKGSRSFADFLCRGRSHDPQRISGGTSKPAPFKNRRVRHPQKISVHGRRLEGLATRHAGCGTGVKAQESQNPHPSKSEECGTRKR